MFGQNTVGKKKHWKTSRREISSPESETVRKGSKSGAPDEIGRYHMYVKGHSDFKVKCLNFGLYTQVSDSGPLGPLVIYVMDKSLLGGLSRYHGYEEFFLLNSGEHEKYKNIKKFSFFFRLR